MDNSNSKTVQNLSAYQKAKEQVEALKSFYNSLLTFVVVNLGIIYVWYEYSSTDFQWFWFPLVGWGLGIAVKALYIFDVNVVYGKQWEQKKIEKLMLRENHVGISEAEKNQSYMNAKKKVDNIKGFHSHFVVYILVNTFIVSVMVWNTNVELLSFSALSTPFFWGIGLAAHALGVFGEDLFFGKNWEDKKIKKMLDTE
jgi:hypothetical protein